jgi:hypothetical protein
MKRFLAWSRYSCLLLSFFFVFVGPTERCDLENIGSPWHAVVAGAQTFQKKENKRIFLTM